MNPTHRIACQHQCFSETSLAQSVPCLLLSPIIGRGHFGLSARERKKKARDRFLLSNGYSEDKDKKTNAIVNTQTIYTHCHPPRVNQGSHYVQTQTQKVD
ncbi:hypothetical protein [Lusitaniella coriacea]|uniref:hypothetical protein n=1 Tax=Lusitaniella coriacea TaxID=1983105 RepID=UPI003CEDA349